jgi:hypothetical protein
MTVPQHIKEEAELYANEISKNDTYREYLRNAYISGRMKSEEECVEFADWINKEGYTIPTSDNLYYMGKVGYTPAELFAIFQQSKAAK